MPLKNIARPADQSDEYQFFENPDTKQKWKVKLEERQARPANVVGASEEVAPQEVAITVTVSPVGNDGKAIREDGKPIVIDSWTHTFNEHEMAEPDFDPLARIMTIVEDRVALGETRLQGFSKVKGLVGNWKTKGKL